MLSSLVKFTVTSFSLPSLAKSAKISRCAKLASLNPFLPGPLKLHANREVMMKKYGRNVWSLTPEREQGFMEKF